jgi:hypothetical protein
MAAPRRRGCLGIPLALWLPGGYLAFAIYAWIDFTQTNRDGLANVGLFLVTFPVTIIDLIVSAMLGRSDILMPDGHGYIGNHALYYFPAALITAGLFFVVGRAIDRLLARIGTE